MMRPGLLLYFIFVITGLFGFGQSIAQEQGLAGRIAFDHFNHEDGLSAPVTEIAQDSLGFLWLGTTDGLNRFDGRHFTTYRNIAGDTNSLPNNIVNDLCVDPGGHIWVATNGGVCYYDFDDDAFHLVSFEDTLERIDRHRVRAVRNGNNGSTWFATKTHLHQRFSSGAIRTYALPGMESLSVSYLYEDPGNALWIGTNDGLFRYVPSTDALTSVRVTSAFTETLGATATVHPVIHYGGDTVLLGSWYGGVHKAWPVSTGIDLQWFEDKAEADPRKHVVMSICRNTDRDYWVGTYGNGLSLLDAETGMFYQHLHADPADPHSLSSDYINAVFRDRSGILWVGTGEGLDKYDPLASQFTSVTVPAFSGEFSIYRLPGSITEDPADHAWLWITVSGSGLYRFNIRTREFIAFRHDPSDPRSLPDNNVYSVYFDRSGRMWVGYSSGVCLFDQGGQRFVPVSFPGIRPKGVHRIVEDSKGRFWFASFSGGAYLYDEVHGIGKAYQYQVDGSGGLPDNRVFCITPDPTGMIWIGTQNRGLCMLNPETEEIRLFEHEKLDPNTIPDNGVYDLYVEPEGNLWIATENGLARMRLADFAMTQYSTSDGLCNNDVFSITPDAQGNLWFATNNGLSKFNRKSGVFKNYSVQDGLPVNSLPGATCMTSTGYLFLGSSGTLTFCRPGTMRHNAIAPPVVITDFRVFDQRRSILRDSGIMRPIKLSHRDNMITFDFAALNFTNPMANAFAYQLEGFNDQWISSGDRPSATFTNLRGGAYTFRVKAANNDGVWNEEGASVQLIVHPPFWQTWWFYVICVTALAGVLYLIYRMRINQFIKLHKIRTRISRDLHDDIGSTLSSISMISSMAVRSIPDEKRAHEMFVTIASASHQAMDLMSDIVWSVNPKNDRMEMVVIRMRQYASEILEAAQIEFLLDVDPNVGKLSLPIESRKDFYLIYKEAINNVAKYSKAGTASIAMQVHHRNLNMSVTDDGVGFDPALGFTGNGLKNMRARADRLNGMLDVISAPGHGTRIILSFPVIP